MSMEREARECEWIPEDRGSAQHGAVSSQKVNFIFAGGDAFMGNTRSHSEHDG
jgi:hypothetical protein